jgi:signal transduction histidine kinase
MVSYSIKSTYRRQKTVSFSKFDDPDYLAMMCHEIGTPLNAIVGFSYILSNVDCSPQKKIECAEMLRDSSNMLMGLMKNMLDSSQMKAWPIEIKNADFNVEKLVKEVLHIITPMAEKKGLGMHVHMANNVPKQCVGDSLRIRQIILNLLSNAVRFSVNGRIDIHVNKKIGSNENNKLTITVADTGIGIEEDEIKNLFSKCEQKSHGSKQKHGGSGLGLYISQNLAHSMHGNITVKSWHGVGSQFTLTLPLKEYTSECSAT